MTRPPVPSARVKRSLLVGSLAVLGVLLALGLLPPRTLAGRPASAPAQAAGEVLPLEAYWQRVQETRQLVADLAAEPPDAQHARLLAAANGWSQVRAVILPSGAQVPVNHAYLCARLRAAPPDLAALGALLDSLLAARDAWPQVDWSAADMETLDQVLARPEYQWTAEEPSALAQWWRRAREWLWEQLGRLIPDSWAGAPLARYALTALGVAALATALFFALRGMIAGLVAEKELDDGEIGEENLSAAAALRRAETLAGGGDYRAAVRYLYLSALLLLEEKGLLHYDRALTNREYLRSVAERPELAAALRRVVEVFERVWYGYEPLDEPAYRQYLEWVAGLGNQ